MFAVSDSSLARTPGKGAASGSGDDKDDVQRWVWPARRHDDFLERPSAREEDLPRAPPSAAVVVVGLSGRRSRPSGAHAVAVASVTNINQVLDGHVAPEVRRSAVPERPCPQLIGWRAGGAVLQPTSDRFASHAAG
jgi:hypothetical protein